MKLKEIPQNVVVHTPTEAEANELLAILHETGYGVLPSLKHLKMVNGYKDEDICFNVEDEYWGHCTRDWYEKKGYTILTLAEFKEKYVIEEEKPQPKFIKGQRVYCRPYGYPFVIADVIIYDNNEPHYYSDNGGCYKESILEPYTEPEAKTTEDMETKELNLVELLKGHEGETFYHLMYGKLRFMIISAEDFVLFDYPESVSLYDNGKYDLNAEVVIYPSRALYEQYPLDPYTAWMKWKEEQVQKHFIQIEYGSYSHEGNFTEKVSDLTYFRTLTDRDKCLGEIKAIIEKYGKK